MCSMRCDRPASGASSADEPVPIQKPSATDRTESMCSVTILTPDSNSVRRCSAVTPGRRSAALGVGVHAAAVARATGAARAAVAIAARAAIAVAIAARAAVALAPRAAAVAAAAHRRELLGRLAGDLRVLGQAQPDAAALAVDLDHADRHLVALVEHLLDRRRTLARSDVRDVQQAVGPLGKLDEGAEGGRLDHLAGVLVADLDLLGHGPDA